MTRWHVKTRLFVIRNKYQLVSFIQVPREECRQAPRHQCSDVPWTETSFVTNRQYSTTSSKVGNQVLEQVDTPVIVLYCIVYWFTPVIIVYLSPCRFVMMYKSHVRSVARFLTRCAGRSLWWRPAMLTRTSARLSPGSSTARCWTGSPTSHPRRFAD